MANPEDKWPENVPGEYYVDDQCVGCGMCCEICPNCFRVQDNGGYSYVCQQPSDDGEKFSCEEAMQSCPVNAIGKDGAA